MDHLAPEPAQHVAQLKQQIAQLEATRAGLPSAAQPGIDAALQVLREQLQTLEASAPPATTQPNASAVSGTVAFTGDARSYGATIGVNQGIVLSFYGQQPPADATELLTSYLHVVLEQHNHLRLSRLLEDERNSHDQTNAPAMLLRDVYTSLATNAVVAGERFELPVREVVEQLEAGDPRQVVPEQMRLIDSPGLNVGGRTPQMYTGATLTDQWTNLRALLDTQRYASSDGEQEAMLTGRWLRPELAVETIATQRRLVLLGDPGSGKSTVLRYLVVRLAEALLDGQTEGLDYIGWANIKLPVPIFCSLARVAKRLGDEPDTDMMTLTTALLSEVLAGDLRVDLRGSMLRAWRTGGAILFLDGLDEVSSVEVDGQPSKRARIAAAIDALAQQVGNTRIVVTCRTKPYAQDRAWQLRERWTVRRLEPFAPGQVTFFAHAWYHEACRPPDAKYPPEEAGDRARLLLDALAARPRLQKIAASPLLLTMTLLLHYNKTHLPDERADVYEALVSLLLERWEYRRSDDRSRRDVTIGQKLGLPKLTTADLRPAIHQIAFEAQQRMEDTANDERGVVPETTLHAILDAFFARKLDPLHPDKVRRKDAAEKTEIFVEVLCEESGLIQAEDDGTYVFPHLTFQEYLAACHLAAQNKVALMYEQWQAGGDRWREPLLLLMRRLVTGEKADLAFSWLTRLLPSHREQAAPLPEQRQRDVILAAACYDAVGRADFVAGLGRSAADFQDDLRAALLHVLRHPAPTMLLPQRVEAGDALGLLGDPRFPVTLDEWRAELARRNERFGQPDGYWCYVRPGIYRIGGWEEDEPSADIPLPAFWIARYPVAVAQFEPFVKVGYSGTAERWWTPEGWRWKTEHDRTEPWSWQRAPYNGPNQPVIGVTWYEATAWAAWLSEQLTDVLPPGYVVRLLTEAEWETAAAYGADGQRSIYPWGDDPPTPERAVYEIDDQQNLGRPAPVGCCPAGRAAGGALDMAGNVWEWTVSSYAQYPQGSADQQKDFTDDEWDVPLRGGSWPDSSTSVRCGARDRNFPGNFFFNLNGFRVIVAPRLAEPF